MKIHLTKFRISRIKTPLQLQFEQTVLDVIISKVHRAVNLSYMYSLENTANEASGKNKLAQLIHLYSFINSKSCQTLVIQTECFLTKTHPVSLGPVPALPKSALLTLQARQPNINKSNKSVERMSAFPIMSQCAVKCDLVFCSTLPKLR